MTFLLDRARIEEFGVDSEIVILIIKAGFLYDLLMQPAQRKMIRHEINVAMEPLRDKLMMQKFCLCKLNIRIKGKGKLHLLSQPAFREIIKYL